METIYCGIDFHKRTSTLFAKKLDGTKVEAVTIKTSNLVVYLSNRKNYLIGIEASGGVNDVVSRLKQCGHDVKIINPNKFKAIGIGGKKTDKKDAEALSEALRLNYIPQVYHKSLYARQLKSMLMSRKLLVRTRVNFVNHTRGILREYGITMPQGVEAFYKNIISCIGELECEFIKEHLMDLLDKIRDLQNREKEIESRMEQLLEDDTRVKILRSHPGIGLMTATAFIAVMDDSKRFEDSKHFASYLGLVPREYSSGDRRRMGSITRSGSEILRRYLIHGARSVLMRIPKDKDKIKDSNRLWARRLKDKVGMNKATVALAHRMSRVAFAMIRDGKNYEVPIIEQQKAA